MIGLGFVYLLMGALTAGVAVVNARDASNPRRWRAALFWGLWSLTFVAGSWLPDLAAGGVVVAMALLAGVGGLGKGSHPTATAAERLRDAARLGHRLFVPALLVPAVTVLGSWAFRRWRVGGAPVVDPKQVTLVALGVAALAGLAAALRLVRPPAAVPVREARRLLDAVGWAAVPP